MFTDIRVREIIWVRAVFCKTKECGLYSATAPKLTKSDDFKMRKKTILITIFSACYVKNYDVNNMHYLALYNVLEFVMDLTKEIMQVHLFLLPFLPNIVKTKL